jgi:small-conductance mechanosensitive channel
MDYLRAALADLGRWDVPLVTFGDTEITLGGVIKIIVLVFVLFFFSARVKHWLVRRLLTRTPLEPATRVVIGSLARYLIVLIGLAVILQTSGIDLTSLNVIAGAVAVGVGFGLQNIVSNFISGLIIMFEQPIRIGDRVGVGTIEGSVTEIGARRTTIVTNDNVTLIVPNSRLITENVMNLHYHEPRVRVRVPVTVAHGPDARLVRRLLLEAAAENPHVLREPPPEVRLTGYQAGGAMAFELLAWNVDRIHARELLVSELNFQIGDKLREHELRLA